VNKLLCYFKVVQFHQKSISKVMALNETGDYQNVAHTEESGLELGKIKDDMAQVSIVPKTLTFTDIRYTVKIPKGSSTSDGDDVAKEETFKPILHGISGEVKGGEALCILGPSGSGKTSLLHIISGRISTTKSLSHQVEGDVTVDYETVTGTTYSKMSGMVTQEDIFEGALTVEETLSFAAALRSVAPERVNNVITALQLETCRGTYIGDDANPYLKGISGGEKRRLAIALEILDPSISMIMLDEPTSGLDAAAAQNVANLLRSLADNGMAVLATLHQPRTTIMARFNKLMVLAKGKSIYTGSLAQYTGYVENELMCQIPIHESPYELLLDALNPAIAKDANVQINKIPEKFTGDVADFLNDTFEESEHCKALVEEWRSSRKCGEGIAPSGGGDDSRSQIAKAQHWLTITTVLLHRTGIVKLRDPICLMTQISSGLIMGLIFGLLYWDVYDKETINFSILDAQMCIVMSVLMAVWLPYDVTLTFPKVRRIFLRERKAGLYTTSQFYCARIAADVPAHIVSSLIMALIVWGMAGLKCNLGGFCLIMVYAILIGASMMQFIGAISRTFEEANIYMMTIMMMSMMLGTGFVREVPEFFDWARDISIMGICADLAMYLEFKDVDPKYGTAEEIFRDYGVLIRNERQFWNGVAVLFYVFLVCRALCYVCVKFLFTGRTTAEDWAD
jgi:ABC-type multidrug transport system ATPase subunit